MITAAVGVLLIALPATPVGDVDLPSPLDGPGHPDLKRRDEKRIAKAVDRLRLGDLDDASKLAGKAGDSLARRLLDLQIRMSGSAEPPVNDLEQLCADHPGYAAAWVTLTVAAEQVGAEATALEAARRSATLWPDSPWASAVGDLQRRWVADRVAEARSLAATGRPDEALELVDRALALEPSDRDSLLAKADVLAELDRVDDADAILSAMPDDPAATIRRARFAERSGDLAAAMALYTAVPAEFEDRDAALRRVRLAWRRQNLPMYVQEAMASEQLTRAGLAVVLVGLLPEANAVGGGQVPLLSDIVELPSQREVLTAVRIGLMDVDRVEHLFHPERVVDPDEVRYALDQLNTLLGRKPPDWCAEDEPESSDCIELTSPVSGAAVADAVLRTAQGEAP